jgi:hypothetical protein
MDNDMKSYGGMNMMMFLSLALSISLAGVAFMTIAMQGHINASANIGLVNRTLTPDEKAAGGPLPGNLSQIEEEQKCIAAEHPKSTNVPWYPTIANTEHGGSERTAVFPCAHFDGSYTKPNRVYAYQSPSSLGGVPSYLVTRVPNEIYVSGGVGSLALPGPVIAKMQSGSLKTRELLNGALNDTLKNIKEKLGGVPTVISSGNGYHIYQPVNAIILEEQEIFSKFEQPSRRLIQFAERYLSNNKMDRCHNHTMSLGNCMLRIPGSFNVKSDPPKEVRIVQTWDNNRPDIKPLIHGCYIYLQDLRLKKIIKQQRQGEQHYHSSGKLCPYWRVDHN